MDRLIAVYVKWTRSFFDGFVLGFGHGGFTCYLVRDRLLLYITWSEVSIARWSRAGNTCRTIGK
jgi:hypothetical protein